MTNRILTAFFSLFFIQSFMYAETIKAQYSVSYGLFGEIGIAKAFLRKDQNTYVIDIKLESTGLAKTLSKGRKERHISTGHIENGLMVSESYKVIRSYASKTVTKEYLIDHKNKKVVKNYKKEENNKQVSSRSEVLEYYAKNDLLTLYFNLDTLVKDKTNPQTYQFSAVGAEKQNGNVTLIIPKKNQLGDYKKTLGNHSAWYATAIIHQKIFSSEEGKLLLGVGADGITNKAVLKDVVFFGDIVAVKK